jgi:hypothetical protein
MKQAHIDGKSIVNRREGGVGDPAFDKELQKYAKTLKGLNYRDDTLEDPDSDIDNMKGKLIKGWEKEYGPAKTAAGLYAQHRGAGRKPDKFTNKLLNTPGAKAELKKAGIDINDPKDMEARVWSKDAGGTGDEDYFAKMGTSAGKERRQGTRNLIDKDAEAGEVTVGTMGIGHQKDSDEEEKSINNKAAFESIVRAKRLEVLQLICKI